MQEKSTVEAKNLLDPRNLKTSPKRSSLALKCKAMLQSIRKVNKKSFKEFSPQLRSKLNITHKRFFFLTKLCIVLLVITSLFILNVLLQYDLYVNSNVSHIYDFFHEITSDLNHWIETNDTAYNWILIIGSVIFDALFIGVWVQWLALGSTMRLPLCQLLFYLSRVVVRLICIFPSPPHYLWRPPTFGGVRFLSLSIPYQKSDDFFFSGHTGFGTLAILETRTYGQRIFHVYAIFVTLYQAFMMILTRGHYTIDMIVGVLVATYFHKLSTYLTSPKVSSVDTYYSDSPL